MAVSEAGARLVDLPDDGRESFHARFIWGIVAVLCFSLWILPLRASLWLDELVTWWVIRDGFGSMLDRSLEYQQAPLYYGLAWIAKTVLGSSEAALRSVSIVCMSLAAVWLYRLSRRAISVEVARLAVLAFVASPWIAFAATDARPYALAILLAVGSTDTFMRWLDEARLRLAFVYVVLIAALVWAHYYFGLVVLVHVAYFIFRRQRSTTSIGIGAVVIAWSCAALLLLPLVPQVVSLWDRRAALSFEEVVNVEHVFLIAARPVVLGGLILGVLLARALSKIALSPPAGREGTLFLLASWVLIPSVILTGASLLGSVTFQAPRYAFSTVPAVAVLLGWAMACVGAASSRRVLAAVFAILAILASGGALKNGEDWRGASAAVRERTDADTIVLVRPGLIESKQVSWFADPERASYLDAPGAYYQTGGRRVLLPHSLSNESVVYLESLVDDLSAQQRFLVLDRGTDDQIVAWLKGRLADSGYRWNRIPVRGDIEVLEFTR